MPISHYAVGAWWLDVIVIVTDDTHCSWAPSSANRTLSPPQSRRLKLDRQRLHVGYRLATDDWGKTVMLAWFPVRESGQRAPRRYNVGWTRHVGLYATRIVL